MPPRIAIPMPHSIDHAYAQRVMPQYERAVTQAGGEPVRILLEQTSSDVTKIIQGCDGILLPGSNADVDPARFKQERSRHTAVADPRRDEVDDLLLDDAYAHRKPVLAICYGLQSLNVHQQGSLIQHIPDFLSQEMRAKVDHEAGKNVAVAHRVAIEADSKLARIAGTSAQQNERAESSWVGGKLIVPVNSSHHQSAGAIGQDLRIVARCVEDGIIEGIEGTSPDHFVIAVQWHPERSVDDDACSRAIFRAVLEAAR